MKKKVLAQFLKDNSKECKLWAFVSCFVCGLLGVFILANLLAAINGLNIVLPLAIAGVLGQVVGGVTTLFDRFFAWIRLNRKKPRILAQLACTIFGAFGGFILALTSEDLGWLGWIIHIGIGALIGLLVGLILAFLHKFDWSGFKDKKLWDWMQLLILPILVAAGSFLFSHQIGKREAKQAELRKQQESLKLYYDQMKAYTDREEVKALLRKLAEIRDKRDRDFKAGELKKIDKILSDAKPDLETIKSLTFTILEGLDGERKSQVVSYLYDVGLMRLEIPKELKIEGRTNSDSIPKSHIASIVRKNCSRLSENQENDYTYESAIHLKNANLNEIDLTNKDLKYINFCSMKLTNAKLSGADLSFANINDTDLKGAILDRAIFSKTEFDYVKDVDQKHLLTMIVNKDSKILKSPEEKARDLPKEKRTKLQELLASPISKDKILVNGRYFPKDLSNANLQKLDLSGVDLSGFNLENSDLSEANLIGANLSKAKLKNAILDRARIKDIKGLDSAEGLNEKLKSVNNISSIKKKESSSIKEPVKEHKETVKEHDEIDLSNMNLDNRDLTDADLRGAKLEGASMKGVILKNADLTGANLENVDLTNANLTGATLVKTNLQNSILEKAQLDKADLSGANLQGANLEKATMSEINAYFTNFDEANMIGVKLNSGDRKKRANLNNCSMGQVDLSSSDLTDAYLISIDFSKSNLQGAVMERVDLTDSKLVSVNLKNAKILEPTFQNTEYYSTVFPENFKIENYKSGLKEIKAENLFSKLPK